MVFDLTPEIVKEKYSEKAELTRLIWSTIICAKHFQPSIIMIDDFETIFSGVKPKKGSGTSSFGPKMKKIMTDMKKNKLWTKNDQIAVVACTNKPYDANIKDMKKMFDKKMYFPYPNYATRKLLIKSFIEEKVGAKHNDFPYETFAHVTEGFTAGSFKTTIDKVLTPFRIERLKDEPLKLSELVNPLSNSICVFAE
jgi:SpoVK/Ycf46/Vps4 family AAA+-type ATPase